MTARRVVNGTAAFLGAAACLLASLAWLRGFPTRTTLPLLVAAVVIPTLTTWAVAVGLGWSPVWSALSNTVVALGFEVALVVQTAAVSELWRGVRDGPARLLSTTLPITSSRWVLVVPLALTWIAAAITAEVLARTRARAGAALAPLALFVAGVAATGGGVGDLTAPAALLAATIAGLLAARAWLARPPLPYSDTDPAVARFALRPLRTAAVLLVIVAAVAFVGVPSALSGRNAIVPNRDRPQRVDGAITPVAEFASMRRGEAGVTPDTVLFKVRGDGPLPPYVTAAHVNLYDGDTWRFDRVFEPTGGRIPDPRGSPGAPSIGQSYEISGLSKVVGAPWMPFLERPTNVDGAEVRYDLSTGMIVPAVTLNDGDRYQVTSTVRPVTFTVAASAGSGVQATVASSPDRDDYSGDAGLNEELDAWIDRIAREENTPEGATPGFLAAAADFFGTAFARVDESLANPAVGGTSFADVGRSLTQDRAGTPEQFATLYALVARRLGVPARVTTGWRLNAEGTAVDGSDDGIAVTAGQAWTWVEVPLTGDRWTVVDPTPRTATPPVEPRESAAPGTTAAPRRSQTDPIAGDGGSPLAPPGDLTIVSPPGRSFPWPLLVVPFALVGLGAALASLQRGLVRRRRRGGGPNQQAAGALAELLDILSFHGYRDLPYRNATEAAVTASSAASAGTAADVVEPARTIAHTANRALYSQEPIDPAWAEAAWHATGEVRRALRASCPRRRRLRVPFRLSRTR